MIEISFCVLTALINRIRGGLFGDHIRKVFPYWATTIARLTTTLIIISPMALYLPWWQFLLGWLLLYVGVIFAWHPWQTMQNMPKDIVSMGIRGLVWTLPAGLMVGNYLFAAAGASMGLLYALGTVLPQGIKDLDGSRTNNSCWGEYLFGAVLGLTLILGIRL
jgi:hypothetical protein